MCLKISASSSNESGLMSMDANRLKQIGKASTQKGSAEIFKQFSFSSARRTDRLFAMLFVFQWLLGIAFAWLLSPYTWDGDSSRLHIHIYLAIFLGGLLASFPVYLAIHRPGRRLNRFVIATSQMA